ncbi:MAG: NAD(P)-dependent oxidoreductase [Ardenticatenaceae bacterium]|nr:NAD(P)-dependent oxidoreductase [Ardenticatenaceae bacterium]MCB9446566.1 NAD(P)-dependent oxidoreductase [Ardenticatenaceae bacterium]
MRILVTGATGFIGRSLIPVLLQRPYTQVVVLRLESESGRPFPPPLTSLRQQFDVVYADLRHFGLMVRAVRQAEPDAVIHLAAVGATEPFLPAETALRHNVTGTINLLRACFEKMSSIQQIIVARTPGERSAMNVYAASKAAAWNFCQMYGRTQQWSIHGAMIFQAYGPYQPEQTLIPSAIKVALAGQDFPMTSGEQKRDWIHVSDVAAGFVAMLGQPLPPGTTVELGTGRLTSVADVVRQIYALTGKGGQPQIGLLPDRPGEEAVQVADVGRTKALVGWETAVSLTNGLRQLIVET